MAEKYGLELHFVGLKLAKSRLGVRVGPTGLLTPDGPCVKILINSYFDLIGVRFVRTGNAIRTS